MEVGYQPTRETDVSADNPSETPPSLVSNILPLTKSTDT